MIYLCSHKVKLFIPNCKVFFNKLHSHSMIYSVSSELYRLTAEHLAGAIGAGSYFSGSVAFESAGVACRLVASVIVYRRRESRPEGETEAIADLVPVWWEFHTAIGEEVPNDFSFTQLRGEFG